MIVCLCHRISHRDIELAVQAGTRSFDEFQDDTCIARNCECCGECAREVFDAACAKVGGRLYSIEEPALA
jgi:bacterioferritin-associated ferredoxin